ncbi:uncharacterized protein [Temnothorax nylanderi]|uniref:uncharacterized protein n=1 Tax=Temnothorax nylanderi TaxID=102681 RepID=UPI003A8A277B
MIFTKANVFSKGESYIFCAWKFCNICNNICSPNLEFSVVVWPDGGTCVVATKWLNESKETVVYPSKTKCFTRLVMSLVDVKEDWEECNVDFLHSYKTFNLANKAAKLAAEDKPIDSNIETDYEKSRKRQLPVKFQNQSSDYVGQSSDDDDRESENMRKKYKRQVVREPRREMQRTKSEEREKSQDVSQVNSVPAPAVNIREQFAALKARYSSQLWKESCRYRKRKCY